MLNITIDGLAGAGKSQLAKDLAKELNLYHFNTGTVYRALACEFMRKFKQKITLENLKEIVKSTEFKVEFVDGQQICKVNGCVFPEKLLRSEKTSMFTAQISSNPLIREMVRKIQRDFASTHNCIMEGRDIGRVVLPNATYKLFLTA